MQDHSEVSNAQNHVEMESDPKLIQAKIRQEEANLRASQQEQERNIKQMKRQLEEALIDKAKYDITIAETQKQETLRMINAILKLYRETVPIQDPGVGCPLDPSTFVSQVKATQEGVNRLREARRLPKEKTERGWGQIASGIALVMTNLPLYYDAQFRWCQANQRLEGINGESQQSRIAKRAKADDKAQEDLDRAENQLLYNKVIFGSGVEGQ